MNTTTRITLAGAFLVMTGLAAAAESPAWIGYGGPHGSRIYKDATPPTTFGDADVIWKTEIPDLGWGHGSPIVVGDKVILAAEYDERHNAFPSLIDGTCTTAPRKHTEEKP